MFYLLPASVTSCADAGPWVCLEPGCPAPQVDCAILSTACASRFSDIWKTLPSPTLAHQRILDQCKASCGECNKCELLHREILTPADAATETLEVQRLQFTLPQGSRASGHSTHVKVRAPDAPGQRNRVRAYSALVHVDARSFNLTVKIYPGGPPMTRGTSAFLGSVGIGALVHVPEVRSMRWATAPAVAKRVGLVAYGVGIAECLEPIELLLASGATDVRLVTSNRREEQILHRERLRALLLAHPGRFAVTHCLSRAAVDDVSEPRGPEQHAEQSCVEGERIMRGRVDEAIVRQAFGDWATDTSLQAPYFLVVGTGAMERSCWTLIRATFNDRPTPSLIAGSTGWRSLVSVGAAVTA